MVDLLQKLLELRLLLADIANRAEGYGIRASLYEIERMQKLEREIFTKVDDWSKP